MNMNVFELFDNIGGIFFVFLNVVTPVFILVLIGYFIGPRLQVQARSLSRPAYFVFVPAFVFNIISKTQIEADLANFGLPLIEFRLGDASRTPATIYFLAIVFISFVICVGVASWARSGGMTAVLSVFKTPALLALIPALAFNMSGVEVPIFLSRLSGLLGQAMIPVMLITLGVQLGEIEKIKINFNVFAASTVRLIGGPVLALLLVPFFGLEGMERSTGILQAAMPAAVLVSIIALEYKLCPEFVTTTVLFSTLYSILSLTIILTLI